METRTYPCGPVQLIFEYNPNPRPDFSLPAAQIRQRMNDPHGLAFIPIRLHPHQPVHLATPGPGGVEWTVRIEVQFPRVYVAREFLPETSPGAVNVLYHERGHIKHWLEFLAGPQCPFCPPISAAYAMASASAHPTPAHVRNAIASAINGAAPGVVADLDEVARRFDRADYPRLHAALRAAHVAVP